MEDERKNKHEKTEVDKIIEQYKNEVTKYKESQEKEIEDNEAKENKIKDDEIKDDESKSSEAKDDGNEKNQYNQNQDNKNIEKIDEIENKEISEEKVESSDKTEEKDLKTNFKEEEKMSEKDKKIKGKKEKKEKKVKKHKKLRLVLKIFFIMILVLIIVAIAGVIAIFKTDKWAITKEQLLSDAGATIYDKDGNVITNLTGSEINQKLELSKMGKLPDAFIAIEDERFYTNQGIDIIRTLHAAVKYVLSGGKSSFGGSTITQQLVKITMNDDERSGLEGIERKIREWSRAAQVEKMLTKDQILERYLNRIYLGSSSGLEVRGVEAAAKFYFNKSASELDLAQTAFIAGINHAPNNYSPYDNSNKNEEKIKTRTLTVLEKMHELGKITDDEYNSAVEETKSGLKFEKGELSNGSNTMSFHTTAAINQIANELATKEDLSYSEAREVVTNSGYKIYTTVDQNVQDIIEDEYTKSKYIKKASNGEQGQSAMVVIEPSTGYIVGEVGALGENQDTLGINRATSARQAGSSFKPLACIAPGLETGTITASTLFNDVRTTFNGNYSPKNDESDGYMGIVNIRDAIRYSLNVPEVKLLSILGVDKSTEFLGKIGMNIDSSSTGLSLALGSASVTPIQMAAGYAMIANKGEYITPTFYTKVVDQNGTTIMEAKQEKTRVMSEQNAYIETSILTGTISQTGGTAHAYNGYLGSMSVAGKTGTSDSAVDRWFCGFTPYYAAACWYGADDGYNYNGKGGTLSFGGSNPASAIWFPTMKRINESKEATSFEKPDGIVQVKICKLTGKKATDSCTDTYTEIFSKDNIPETCEGHTAVKICKETGLLATAYCTDTEEKVFGGIIDTEKNAKWSPKFEETEAPTTTCNVHATAPKIAVPNVVGKTQSEAEKTLKAAGFKIKIVTSDDDKKVKGIVLKQSATTAPKESEITITVNSYNGKVETTNTTTNTTTDTETNTNTNTNTSTSTQTKNEATTNNKTEN